MQPLIRLATIYLVYAEAVTRSKGATPEVYNLMNELRARSFMAPIPPAAQTNKELLLDYILRERRVELYHEKSRFFSTRFYLEPTSPEELAKDAQWSSIQGTNDQKAQLYFDKYGAYPKDAAPHLRPCAPWKTPTARYRYPQDLPHGTLLEGGSRIPREALPLPDPDRRVAAGQHSAKPQLVIDNHRPDRPNRPVGLTVKQTMKNDSIFTWFRRKLRLPARALVAAARMACGGDDKMITELPKPGGDDRRGQNGDHAPNKGITLYGAVSDNEGTPSKGSS